jgi:hypothetical protein
MKTLILFLSIIYGTQTGTETYSFDGVKIGMTISELFSKLKKENKSATGAGMCYQFDVNKNPDKSGGAMKVIYQIAPYFNNESIDVEFAFKNSNACTVGRIYISSKDFKSREGIGVGNTVGDLKRKYTFKEFITDKACKDLRNNIIEEEKVGIVVEEANLVFYPDQYKLPRSWRKNPTFDGLSDDLKIYMICIS